MVFIATIVATTMLYIKTPKGYFPQDDTGLIIGGTTASNDISFKSMVDLHRQVAQIVGEDPAVAGVGSSVGGSSFSGQANAGNMFVTLKPLNERNGLSAQRVIDRIRNKVAKVPGVQVWLFPAQDLRVGGRQGNGQYQFTLWSDNFAELMKWLPQVEARVKTIDGITDVSSDRNQGGLQLEITVDRPRASNLGVKMQAIDSSLSNAFAQRQISTIYSPRNQYRVILESIRNSSATRATCPRSTCRVPAIPSRSGRRRHSRKVSRR